MGAVLMAILTEFAGRIVMVDNWATYLLPHNYAYAKVKTTAGPISAEWTSNSLGFHDREHERRKPPSGTRVVCIGDSFLDQPTTKIRVIRPIFILCGEASPHE